jgi:hypothetical protein
MLRIAMGRTYRLSGKGNMAAVEVFLDDRVRPLRLEKLIMAGYTGRDQGEVQAHIDELSTHGIPAPDQIPTLFACSTGLLTTSNTITVLGTRTSGEGEVALFVDAGEILVGVGSDHTDRALEVTDIPRAKQVCAKVVSDTVWRFADVMDHWDELVLRSWIQEGADNVPYQEGTLARLLRPEDILAYVRQHVRVPLEPAVLFAGTLPLLTDGFRSGSAFTVELEDPRWQRRLRCHYQITVLDYLR